MTYKIIPCENGVGEWEVVGDDIATQVFDLRSEAEQYLTHLKSRKSKMTKLTVNKIYDCRNMGQLYDGYPLLIWLECSGDDGAEYKGWYYPTDDMRSYLRSNGTWINSDKKFYFHQSKLSSGKKCNRKVSPKINKMMLELLEANKSSVEDLSKHFGQGRGSAPRGGGSEIIRRNHNENR